MTHCEVIRLDDGTVVFVRRRGPRLPLCACGRAGSLQCDYPVGRGQTCDRYLCRQCAVPQGDNVDYCPGHPNQHRQGALAL